MESSELLKTQTIHYLDPSILRSFSDMVILSDEGTPFRVNSLIFLSKSHYLKRVLEDVDDSEEQALLITDIPSKDLSIVVESLISGEMMFPPEDIKGIVSALEALGLQSSHFGPSFYYNNVTLKMEVDEDEEEDGEGDGEGEGEERENDDVEAVDEDLNDIQSWDNTELELPTCTICLESFIEQSELDKHVWNHFIKKEKKLYCISCQKFFMNIQSLKSHVVQVHEGMDIKTPPSDKSPAASVVKKSKSKVKKPSGPLKPSVQCVNCGQYNAIDPERFLDIHASSNPFHTPDCNYDDCNESFTSYSEHMAHVKSVHNGKFRIKCGRCGSVFSDLPSLTAHKKEVHHARADKKNGKKVVDKAALTKKEKCVCELCGMSLSRGNMRTHIKVVHGNDPVDCDICKKTFNHPMSLKLHSDSAHREFPCAQCGFMCRSPKAYKLHLLSKHTLPELKPFQCIVCGKGFTTAYKFKQHENIHRGIKPHICKFCGKGFCNSSNRNQHEKSIHLGDKRVKSKSKISNEENST